MPIDQDVVRLVFAVKPYSREAPTIGIVNSAGRCSWIVSTNTFRCVTKTNLRKLRILRQGETGLIWQLA